MVRKFPDLARELLDPEAPDHAREFSGQGREQPDQDRKLPDEAWKFSGIPGAGPGARARARARTPRAKLLLVWEPFDPAREFSGPNLGALGPSTTLFPNSAHEGSHSIS